MEFRHFSLVGGIEIGSLMLDLACHTCSLNLTTVIGTRGLLGCIWEYKITSVVFPVLLQKKLGCMSDWTYSSEQQEPPISDIPSVRIKEIDGYGLGAAFGHHLGQLPFQDSNLEGWKRRGGSMVNGEL